MLPQVRDGAAYNRGFMPQFIYTMKGLGKVYPPDQQVLKDIWLSFLPGAKIGVLGLNGAGKSSLLKIMAGEDTSFIGEAFPADGITVGFLHQEPQLNPSKTVKENVEEGVEETKKVLDRGGRAPVLIFDDVTGEQIDMDFRGTPEDVLKRLPPSASQGDPAAAPDHPGREGPRGPGRPRLGVVAREVTKQFEEIVRAPASAHRERLAAAGVRGEFTVVIPA